MEMMKAIRIHAYGGTENLKYDEVPLPKPKLGEVLIQVYAADVNPINKDRCMDFGVGGLNLYFPNII